MNRPPVRPSAHWALIPAAAVLWLCLPARAHAQTDVEELGRAYGAVPPPGYYETLRRYPNAFQFSPDNGWIRRSRAIQARRTAARAAAALELNYMPTASVAANDVVSGTLAVPVFLILYSNTDSAATVQNLPRSIMEERLYGTQTAPPYSVHSYYDEISAGNLTVNGVVYDWARVPGSDTYYEGPAGCNGLCGSGRVPQLLTDIVHRLDTAGVNFAQFDNDGPDGIPNSPDDDGFVDAVVMMHPEVGGECKNVVPEAADNIWAHRWSLTQWGRLPVTTNDSSTSHGFIKVNDYIIQGAQGGDGVPTGRGGCEPNKPQSMGVVAHETGHLFGLPDLYDTSDNNATAGIGRWGLMGAGNQQVSWSPTHMEAWSRAQLGWVTEVMIAQDTVLDMNPIELSDTAFVVPVANSNEYFLLENRQRIGSDAMIIQPGLLIWHADSVLIRTRGLPLNLVNASLPHGLALEQADGLGSLDKSGTTNKGDSGDPFPGSTGNHEFSYLTNPSSNRNDGTPSFVSMDQIALVPSTNVMRVRVSFPWLVTATDTLARIRLDGAEYGRFYGTLNTGDHVVEMDSVQMTPNGRRRFTWLSWSDGGALSHTFPVTQGGDSLVADVATEYLAQVAIQGSGGTVAATPAVNVDSGAFLAKGASLKLVARVTTAGNFFEGWTGDTTASDTTLNLVMNRPYAITATFASILTVATDSLTTAVMGAPYQSQLTFSGGTGTGIWTMVSGALPSGMALSVGGLITGTPEVTGTFSITIRVVSGSQTQEKALTLRVAAPELAISDVLKQVTKLDSVLTPDEVHYLDLLGNRNGWLDVGDFLAWVDSAALPVSPEVLRALKDSAKEERP